MNIAPLCVLIIITVETDGFHVGNIIAPAKEVDERIPLRKLHSFQPNDGKEAKTATWNQILADALVNRIKITFHKVTDNENTGDSNNILTNCISQMMYLYKTLIYDKFEKPNTKRRSNENTELNNDNNKVMNTKKVDIETENSDPKDDVEIIEPRYHGKLCNDCDPQNDGKGSNGLATTESVQSVACEECDTKSKFILSIPHQCPIGYRRDWFGYCRPQL